MDPRFSTIDSFRQDEEDEEDEEDELDAFGNAGTRSIS